MMKKVMAMLLMLMMCVGLTINASAADTYHVTVNGGTGSGDYKENARVTVKANEPPEGQVFVRWDTSDNLNGVILIRTKFLSEQAMITTLR